MPAQVLFSRTQKIQVCRGEAAVISPNGVAVWALLGLFKEGQKHYAQRKAPSTVGQLLKLAGTYPFRRALIIACLHKLAQKKSGGEVWPFLECFAGLRVIDESVYFLNRTRVGG